MLVFMNFLQRWWWLVMIQFVVTMAFWMGAGVVIHLGMLPAIVMSLDLMRGLSRSVLALPVARKSLARMIWVSSVVVPAVVSLAAMALALLLSSKVPWSIGVWHCAIAVVFPGLITYILTGLPARPSEGILGKVRDTLYGGLWGLSISGSCFLSIFLQQGSFLLSIWVKGAIGLAAVLTIASYFTVEKMVLQRANRYQAKPAMPSSSRPAAIELKRGWPVWWKIELRWHILLGSMMVFGMALGSLMTFSGSQANHSGIYTHLGMFSLMTLMPVFALGIDSLRGLRMLPISTSTLATLFVLRPLVQSLIISGILLASLAIWKIDDIPASGVFLVIAFGSVAALAQAVILRNPRPWLMIVCMSFGAPLMMGVTLMTNPQHGFSWTLLPVAVGTYLLAWLLTRRWIRRSSKLYRPQGWFLRIIGGAART
jgi:hypothetical protein